MADEFPLGNGRWWDISRNRFESVTRPPASITLWPPMDSGTAAAVAGGSFVLHGGDQSSTCGSDSVLANQIVGLGLSTENMDWNQALLGGKAESSFCSMLEQDMSTSNTSQFQHVNDINRGFSLDQFSHQASSNDSSTITSQKLVTNFQGMNSSPDYHDNQTMINYPTIYNPSSGSYGANSLSRQTGLASASHLNFTNTNNTPFWNASEVPAAMPDARTSFFPADQVPAVSCFDGRPKNTSEVKDLVNTTTTKKNNTEQTPNKRPRNETPSSLPAFKVRKEKMGDRITALQQLVSPFGKTDTASVLSEAIEYIKFLHEQVNALSSPYMKNGAPIQHQQNLDKYKHEITEGPRQDLRSRGLCLVPVSSTFPMTHETTVDFWTPTFGGTFR